jgi:hypothetical protein
MYTVVASVYILFVALIACIVYRVSLQAGIFHLFSHCRLFCNDDVILEMLIHALLFLLPAVQWIGCQWTNWTSVDWSFSNQSKFLCSCYIYI